MKNTKSGCFRFFKRQEKDILIRKIADKLINFNARSYIEGEEYLHSAKKAFNNKEKNKYDYVDFDYKKQQQEKIYKKIEISERELKNLVRQQKLKIVRAIFSDINNISNIISKQLNELYKNESNDITSTVSSIYQTSLNLKDTRKNRALDGNLFS